MICVQDCIRCCREQIEEAVATNLQTQQPAGAAESSSNQHSLAPVVAKTTNAVAVELPTTPTDIREVHPD